jgi:hypothetical protein
VSSGWRAVVDSYWLLHPYVLPMAVSEIFVNYMDYCRKHLIVRPGCNLPAGSLDFVPRKARPLEWSTVGNHCNGLVLYDDGLDFHVVNPVTRRWARPPPYLVFEPVVSRHYEMVLDHPPSCRRSRSLPPRPRRATPPPPWTVRCPVEMASLQHRFGVGTAVRGRRRTSMARWSGCRGAWCTCSRRGPGALAVWEVRALIRLGDAAGTVADVRLDPVEPELFSALRRLSYIMRYSLKIYSPDRKISLGNFVLLI